MPYYRVVVRVEEISDNHNVTDIIGEWEVENSIFQTAHDAINHGQENPR